MNTRNMCLHDVETRAVAMPSGSRHWKALECARCGAHLRFLPWPENQQQRIVNLGKLEWLWRNVPESETENALLRRLVDQGGRLSVTNQARFDAICAKYGVPPVANVADEKGEVSR
jgi:hypothetical protein